MAYTKPSNINSLWAATGTKVPPDSSKRSLGWTAEKPSWQYFNSILNRTDTFNAYINERGIVEWDNVTEYQANKSYVAGSDGNIYKCLVTNTNIDPISDNGTNWLEVWNNEGVVNWNLATTYNEGAVVRYTDGESYTCHTSRVAGTLPTDFSTFINTKYYGSYSYAVSQLANGVASKVGYIYAGNSITAFDYLVYPADGRIYAKNGATGTFSDPLDFDPDTGIDSDVTGELLNKSIQEISNDIVAINNKLLLNYSERAIFCQREVSGSGGSSVAGSNKRVLNTVPVNTISGASLSGVLGDFILPAGTYLTRAYAPCRASNISLLRIYNSTASSYVTEMQSIGGWAAASDDGAVISTCSGVFTISVATTLYIDHYIGNAVAGSGLGVGAGVGGYNQFTTVEIFKL